MVTKAMPPLVTRVLPRGNWQDQSGAVVEPAVPRVPAAARRGRRSGRLTRLDLARWLTAPENPLTARVFMNRLWKQFFGTGISSLVEDVGAQGEWPVHPELLDWLAVEFRDSGWNVKRMVKLLVMSATYRQDSRLRPELRDIDPSNRLLASQSPRRLEAEFVRDNALAIAGLLNLDIGGPERLPLPAGRLLRQPPVPRSRLRRRHATTASIAAASTCTGSGPSSTRCWPTSTPPRARNAPPREPSPTRRSRPSRCSTTRPSSRRPGCWPSRCWHNRAIPTPTGSSGSTSGPWRDRPARTSGNRCRPSWTAQRDFFRPSFRGRPAPPRRPGTSASGVDEPSWPPGPRSAGSCWISMKRSRGIEL